MRIENQTAVSAHDAVVRLGRRRVSGETRRELIVRQAAEHFSERGFGATTRELACALGVTQALLYRYFSSKAEIIDTVFDHVFVADWDEAWGALITDRRLPLEDRLTRFYSSYLGRRSPVETRLFMRAALDDMGFPDRYTPALDARVLAPIAIELRHERRPADAVGGGPLRLDRLERERVMVLHAGLVFLNVRRHIYGTRLPANLETLVRLHVTTFLNGALR
jgi:AcrR family transcriptional regulator